MIKRIKPKYIQEIKIPKNFKKYLWDCPNGVTYVEKLILRVLQYGNYEEIMECFKKLPEQTYDVAKRYPLRRGVKFWIEYWYERKDAGVSQKD